MIANNYFDKKKTFFWKNYQPVVIGIILFFSLVINISPFLNYSLHFPPSPDTAGLVCGVRKIDILGKFNGDSTGFFISPCWTKNTYPLNQITVFNLSKISGLSIHTTAQFLAIVLTTLITYTIYILSFRIFQKVEIALLSAFFAITSGSLARSLILTPQNLYGYFIIILILWLLVKYRQTKNKSNLFIIFLALLSLSIFHQLSLFIITLIIFIYLLVIFKNLKPRLLIFLSFILLASLASALYVRDFNFIKIVMEKIYEASTEGFIVTDTTHPLWALPAALGYVTSILGLLGLVILWKKKSFSFYPLFIILLVIPLLFSQTYFIGFNLAPHRFVAFAWIPLALAAPWGILWLFSEIRKTRLKNLIYLILPFILLGTLMQVVNYQQSDMKGFGEKYLPNQDTLVALNWLNDNSLVSDTLLTTFDRQNRKSIYFPYLFQGKVISYPLYAFKSLEKFEIVDARLKESTSTQILQPRGMGKIVKPLVDIDEEKILKNNEGRLQFIHNIFIMVTSPDSQEAKDLYEINNVQYFLAWRGSPENRIFSEKAGNFDKVYENNSLLIYKRSEDENKN